MYVYIQTEPALWTVGFYAPNGEWYPESDHDNPNSAAERVAWLRGGKNTSLQKYIDEKINDLQSQINDLECKIPEERRRSMLL